MKMLPYLTTAFFAWMILSLTVSCHFAPSQDYGDTVAANVFYPIETPVPQKKDTTQNTRKLSADSLDIYYIGKASNREYLQLVSYPSRKDTAIYGKTRHIKIKGCADIGHVVKVQFYLLNGKDSLVKAIEEVNKEQNNS